MIHAPGLGYSHTLGTGVTSSATSCTVTSEERLSHTLSPAIARGTRKTIYRIQIRRGTRKPVTRLSAPWFHGLNEHSLSGQVLIR